jgi:hypothetical protein
MPHWPDTDPAQGVADRWVFYGLLALLVWAPLPLGSNRFWAIGLLLLIVSMLLLGALLAWWRYPVLAWQRLSLFKWPLLLLACMLSLSWLQTLPLPPNWVAALSPQAAAAQAGANAMTLSIDVYQSRVMASLSFVYFGAFLLAALTVRQASRLDILAQTLVWSGVAQAVLAVVLLSIKARLPDIFRPPVASRRRRQLCQPQPPRRLPVHDAVHRYWPHARPPQWQAGAPPWLAHAATGST